MAKESNWKIRPYQVIITDLHMPNLNGLQASEKIYEAFKECSNNKLMKPQVIIHSGERNQTIK